MEKEITLGSLFDGIGGFPFCAELSGITPVWAAEIEPACVAVTKRHFPNMVHFGDVSKISGAEIPPVDLITFGSPCQDVSVAGKRKGIKHKGKGDGETTRSGLFFEAVRIIYEMREATHGLYPTFIVWENVPGAFSSHKGRDFQTVLEEITKSRIPMPASGRWANAGVVRGSGICAAWRLLDAKYWGVPQRRKRIYLIGSFGSNCAEEILFKRDSVQRYLAPRGTQGQGTAADSQNSVGNGSVIYDARGNGDGKTAPTITGDHNNRVTDYSSIVCMATQQGGAAFNQGENAKYDFEISDSGVNSTLVSKGPSAVCYNICSDASNAMQSDNPYSGIYEAEQTRTLDGNGGNPACNQGGTVICQKIVEWIVRRLTPLECERLQGYPDGWTKIPKIETMSDSDYELFKTAYMLDKQIRGKKVKAVPNREQLIKWYNKLECDGTRYKQLGNSLAIPCALRVISGITEYIRKEF